VAGVIAAAAIAGGFLAAAAPAQAAEATNTAATVSTISEVGKAADVAPLARVYRGSFLYLSTCDAYGRSWVSSGAARSYNCGLDYAYPGLPWSLYTYH
jgi:hypothetical protein